MSSQQHDEEAVFYVTRGIDDSDLRSTYLNQVCVGDRGLRGRVEALLKVHDAEVDFLKTSPEVIPTADHNPLTESPGSTIGRYRLMEQIGEGGMGIVFVAEQQRPIRRKVALKVIKPGMDTTPSMTRPA
jgi:serine/threonine protein kinase